LITAFPR